MAPEIVSGAIVVFGGGPPKVVEAAERRAGVTRRPTHAARLRLAQCVNLFQASRTECLMSSHVERAAPRCS